MSYVTQIGGSASIVEALVRGIEKNGGQVMLRSHVEEVSGR
jgi:phytoene dehydrogenase-like protein